jgi:hypothetical protein
MDNETSGGECGDCAAIRVPALLRHHNTPVCNNQRVWSEEPFGGWLCAGHHHPVLLPVRCRPLSVILRIVIMLL